MHGTVKSRSRADLHMHTNCSDGWPSPAELVDHAIARTDLRVIAVTDHDTLEGALRAVEHATPGFYVFNRMARRLSIGLGAAGTGSSDAHILDAVGRAYTAFRGRTAADLRRSIEARETVAGRSRYKAVGLMRYAAWGFNHQRYAAVAR